MVEDDPYSGIRQQLVQLLTEDKLSLTEVEQIVRAVALLSQVPETNCQQKLLLKIGLLREEDLWQLAYKQTMAQLKQVLTAEQIKIVKQVIIEGVKK